MIQIVSTISEFKENGFSIPKSFRADLVHPIFEKQMELIEKAARHKRHGPFLNQIRAQWVNRPVYVLNFLYLLCADLICSSTYQVDEADLGSDYDDPADYSNDEKYR